MNVWPAVTVVEHSLPMPKEIGVTNNSVDWTKILDIQYVLTGEQITYLKDSSTTCKQYLSVNCSASNFVAKITGNQIERGIRWKRSKEPGEVTDYIEMGYWTGGHSFGGCACALDGSCAKNSQNTSKLI